MNFIKLGLSAVIAKLESFSSEEYWTLKVENKNKDVSQKLQGLKIATYHNSGFAAKRVKRIEEGHKKYAQEKHTTDSSSFSSSSDSYDNGFIAGYASGYTSGSSNNP